MYNGCITEVLRRYYRGTMDVLWAAGGRVWLMGAVLNGYGYERYIRTGESGGGFRSSVENTGQAGGLAYGAGTMALVCLGRVMSQNKTPEGPLLDTVAVPG
jgi:hypothetical protein